MQGIQNQRHRSFAPSFSSPLGTWLLSSRSATSALLTALVGLLESWCALRRIVLCSICKSILIFLSIVMIGLSRFLPTTWRGHVIGDAAAEHPVVVKNKHFFSKTNNTEQQVNAPSTVPRTYQNHKSEDLPLATNKDTPFNIDSQVGDPPNLVVSWRRNDSGSVRERQRQLLVPSGKTNVGLLFLKLILPVKIPNR